MKKTDLFVLKKEKMNSVNDVKNKSKVNAINKSFPTNSPKSLNSTPKKTIEKIKKKNNGFNISKDKEIIDSSFMSNSFYNSGRWKREEHHKFLEGLIKYGNDWKMVQQIIKTRTSSQSRSHAQKFFLKLRNLIKNKKIYGNRDILYDIIYNRNKDILEEIKLNEEQKKKLVDVIISNINLNEKDKKKISENKNKAFNEDDIYEDNNNYDDYNYYNKFQENNNSNNKSFHSDEYEESEDKDNNNNNNNINKGELINKKREREKDDNLNDINGINEIKNKQIFRVLKAVKYKYSDDYKQYINNQNMNNINTNANISENKKNIINNNNKIIVNKFIINTQGNNNNTNPKSNNSKIKNEIKLEAKKEIINNNNINNFNSSNNIGSVNNIINFMNNWNNINSIFNADSNNINNNINIYNNNINNININNINLIYPEYKESFNDDGNYYFNESHKKILNDYNLSNFNLQENENKDEISIIEKKNIYFVSPY